MNIQDFRKQYPQYDDMSDVELADAIHGKYYSDLPKDDVYSRLGIVSDSPMSVQDTVLGGLGSAGKGVPLVGTYLDEVAAALNAGVVDPLKGEAQQPFGDRYKSYVRSSQDLDRQFEKKHPIAAVGLPLATGAYGATGIGGRLLNPTTPLGMGASGAVTGAAYASGENPDDRLGSGLMSGVAGGVLGFGLGKVIDKLAPKAGTTADEFVGNYVQNKKDALLPKVIGGADLEAQMRAAISERGGPAFGANYQFPPEMSAYLKKGTDLYSLDNLRSQAKDDYLRDAITKVIADQVPVDFRADYAKAMKLGKIDDALNKAGGDPLKIQTQMRNIVTGKNARGWTADEIAAGADAGREGLVQGLFTGKTLPMLTYALESTPVLGGLVAGGRVAANENILNKVQRLRDAVTGDEAQGLLTRAGAGLAKKSRGLLR